MPAGRFTDTLPDSEALHLPLQARTAVMGVLSVLPAPGFTLDLSERELLEAFAVLIGLLLEKDHIAEAFKRAEILETSERLRRTVLDSVSHELKTPLAAVQTGLAALERQTEADNAKKATLGEMRGAVRRLTRVIDNLLDMTRIEAGVVQPKLDWSDVEELIHGAIELAGESLSGINIKVDVQMDMPMVKIDHALIEQALCNLLVNAANWCDAGGTIGVQAKLQGDELVISVVDSGPGIAEVDLLHVFEKFYRGANARPGGTGLGLSIVEGFVRAHRGTVRAANRTGGGAEFQMRLPVETLDEKDMEQCP
jgi:two-component system sensor histidine kinase KdpD